MAMTKVDVNISSGPAIVEEPWIWRLCRSFEMTVTMKKASVDADYGWIQLQFEGPVEEIQRAIAWLMTTGMNVESQQRAVGA